MAKDDKIGLIVYAIYLIVLAMISISRIPAPEVKCIDGDTFSMGKTWYRLSYIDTPEKGQPGYAEASSYTCDYLKTLESVNKLKLKTHGKDIYGRTLVEVNPQFFYSLNEILVGECLAKPFYKKTNKTILDLYTKCK